MAESPCNGAVPRRRPTWLSSREIRRFSRSSQSTPSPLGLNGTGVLGSPVRLTDDPDWYKKVACCHLEKDGMVGQGIIFCPGLDRDRDHLVDALGISTYPALVLLTNHHIIPGHRDVKNWKLRISDSKTVITLDERKFLGCKSCCGEDGVWNREKHALKCCPAQADFTLLPLSEAFATEIFNKRDLFFPVVMPLDMESLEDALKSQRFYIYQRDKDTGHIRNTELDIQKRAPTTDDTTHVRGRIEAYKGMCMLNYSKCSAVDRGSSGAGIFFKDTAGDTVLLGLHCSSMSPEDGNEHFGIAIQAIVHAITDAPEVCGIVSSLSLLKEAAVNGCLAKQWYDKLQNSLQPIRGGPAGNVVPVQAIEEERKRKDSVLNTLLEILHYLLVEKIAVLEQGNPLSVPSIDLLASVFSRFGSEFTVTRITAEIEKVFPEERERDEFYKEVREAMEQVYSILSSQPSVDVLESCFNFWHKISYFPLPEPVLFNNAAKFATLRRIRESHLKNATIQRLFADICVAYQSQLKSMSLRKEEERERGFRKEFGEQREQHEREKAAIEKRVQEQVRQREQEVAEEMEKERKEKEEVSRVKEEKEQLLTRREQELVDQTIKIEQLEQQNSNLREDNEDLGELRGQYAVLQTSIDNLRGQNTQLTSENERQAQEIVDLQRQHMPRQRINTYPTGDETYSARSRSQATLLSPSDSGLQMSLDFWQRDMSELLNKDVPLRKKISEYFVKNSGAKSGTWENLVEKLEVELQLDMDMEQLDKVNVAEIIMGIVSEWSKKEKVSVERFCEVSDQLGVTRVRQVMKEAEENSTCRNSASSNV